MLAERIVNASPVNRLRQEMDRLFDGFVQEWPGVRMSLGMRTFPALNVWEDERNVYFEAELPGVSREDLDITVARREVTIRGERRSTLDPDARCHRRECSCGRFSRALRLPVDLDPDHVTAELRNGVLTVTMAKAETAVMRRIEVESGSK